MKKKSLGRIILLVGLTLAGCSGAAPDQPAPPAAAPTIAAQGAPTQGLPAAQPTPDAAPVFSESEPNANCYGDEINQVGQGIANSYEIAYEQVMTLFCNGYLFEDILLALESSEQSGIAVEELLGRLDQGYTWDEIWVQIGILDN
ncbi:MAG: hypothetical protein N2D54_03095 [Chloroflexota bacterium]